MIVLGVDPGLATLGWGVIEAERGRQRLVDYGCILTTPQQSFPDRLCQIGRDMRALLRQYRPEEIAFEELFFGAQCDHGAHRGRGKGREPGCLRRVYRPAV